MASNSKKQNYSKTVYRYFSLADFEQEQEYLRRQHQAGWKLEKIMYAGFYRFTRTEPEDVIYQLDFNDDNTMDKEDYIQLFSDCGWEYLWDYSNWSYFRKPASQADDNEEIFSDVESKLQMMNRVFRSRMIPIAVIFLLIVLPQLMKKYNDVISTEIPTILDVLLFTIFLTASVIYTTMFVNFAIRYRKLRRRNIR